MKTRLSESEAEAVEPGQYKVWTADYGLRAADCGLGIIYGLGIKRGLENRLGIKYGQGMKRGLRTGYKIRTTDYFGKNGAN